MAISFSIVAVLLIAVTIIAMAIVGSLRRKRQHKHHLRSEEEAEIIRLSMKVSESQVTTQWKW